MAKITFLITASGRTNAIVQSRTETGEPDPKRPRPSILPHKLKMATPRFNMQFILDHTDVNAVDLSVMSLTTVPVKELVSWSLTQSAKILA